MRINSTDLQNAFGKYLSLCKKADIIVTKNGKNIAKLVSYREPEELLLNEAQGAYNVRKRISYEEFESITSSADQRYELINGQLYLLASPTFRHQVVSAAIFDHLRSFFRGHPCQALSAPLDIRLQGQAAGFSQDPNVVQPDLVVICDQEKVTASGKYEGTPSLIVEILSPSSKGKDLATKLDLYMRSGVSEYWVADPDSGQFWQYVFNEEGQMETASIFKGSERVESALFPGLVLKPNHIFTKN